MRAFNCFATNYWRKAHGMDEVNFLERCLSDCRGVRGILHVGAHRGQEAELYCRRGIDRVLWIEANPDLEEPLTARVKPLGHRVVMAAVGSHCHTGSFYVTSNDGESSSLLPLGTHATLWPNITVAKTIDTPVRTLDSIHDEHGLTDNNFWVLDVQGGEADVLRGSERSLAIADYVLCEFGESLYQGGTTVEELDQLLSDFSAVQAWDSPWGIGEILFCRVRRTATQLLRIG